MDLTWLEDFLELVATRNYMAAASARGISQPAFSRRIMALETWVGAPLVDRSTYPIKLTKVGQQFLPRCQTLVQDLHRLQADCRQQTNTDRLRLRFSALHTIAMFQFPGIISRVEEAVGSTMCTMHADDFHECLEQLTLGNCDFAIMYDHAEGPPVLRAGPFVSMTLGKEPLVPISAVGSDGEALYDFERDGSEPLPYLSYSWNDGYIGRLVSLAQSRQKRPIALSTVYESALAEGIKRMAAAGKGIGWLPYSCVADAIERGELCQIGGPELVVEMDVRIYRRQGAGSADVEAFWAGLTEVFAAAPAVQKGRTAPAMTAKAMPPPIARQGSGSDIFNAKIT
ncbi:MAG: LysR substrate-binding domain-containing protein [Devosia sp.]